ncbi:MAG TPA: hypothetical protein VN748_02555 [Pseudonocardiaceae bacterium]|jgi:hypothetical protein|nr:hypothetical protein [Pseudonocardiaceae bacterium]
MAISSPELTKAAVPAFVEGKLHATKQAVQATAEQVKQHLHTGRKAAQDKAGEAALQAKSTANDALAELPTALSGRVGQLAKTVRHRPVPTASVLFGVLVLLVLRLMLRRNG